MKFIFPKSRERQIPTNSGIFPEDGEDGLTGRSAEIHDRAAQENPVSIPARSRT
jgi:hypothetical protein